MIRIRYEPFTVRGARSGTYVRIHRPMIVINALGPAGSQELNGLVDTGADDTLLPDELISKLGASTPPGDRSIIVGIEGSMTVVRYGSVDLEIPGAGGGYRRSARVGFHAGHRIVFGHGGFLEYFTASFNGRARHLTLTPNGNARASADR